MATTAATTEPATKKQRPSCKSTDMAPGTIIQGGTCREAVVELRKKLAQALLAGAAWQVAFLFPNDKGEFDATELGGVCTKNPKDFDELNITPCDLPDPTIHNAWDEKMLLTFYNLCNQAKITYIQPGSVAILCVGGNNRSMAMAYAISGDPKYAPRCPAMRSVAEGFINGESLDFRFPIFPPKGLRSRGSA